MVWNTNADSIKMVVIKMVKIGIFRQNKGELARGVFFNEVFGGV